MAEDIEHNPIENKGSEEANTADVFVMKTLKGEDEVLEIKANEQSTSPVFNVPNLDETLKSVKEEFDKKPKTSTVDNTQIVAVENTNGEIVGSAYADYKAKISMIGKTSLEDTLKSAQQKIVEKASEQISDNTKIDEKAETLAKLVDKQFAVDAETKNVEIEEQNVSNKARKKELRNRLIVLRNEAKRIKKDQKNLNRVQRLEHKTARKVALWETYGQALTELGYDYVPNRVTLAILMFLNGAKAFINGMNKIGNALIKCLKWVLIVGGVLAVIFIIPVTRNWLLTLLGFVKKV